MSIQAPQGILNIPNAILRVGKLSVDEVVGADTILNTVARNTILLVDDEAYHENKNWSLKLPNAWAGEFECNTASAGNYSEFNFYNEGASSNAQGYNLTFNDTAVELRYDGTLLKTGTLASTITGTGVKKVRLMFERTILSVTVDGTLVFTHDDTVGPRPRVYSTTAGGFLNFFTDGGALKNLKIVNEKWMSDGTSNIAYVGGGEVAVGQALAFNRVSNVSQIKVDSNVVTEYTGPHDRPLRKYPEVAMTGATTGGYTASGSSRLSAAYEYYEAFDGLKNTSVADNILDLWLSAGSKFDSNGIAETGAGTSNTFPGTSYRGEYCALKLPKAIKLDNFHLFPRGDASSYANSNPPKDLRVFGSNDGTTWTHIKQFQNLSFTGRTGLRLHVNDSNMYNEYAFFVEKITVSSGGATYCAIGELELYGHEEGDSSLDTTLKSVYNVPGTQQLEVYYDGQDYSSLTTTVNDKVGTATNATIANTDSAITFDSTYKAWTFGGTDTRTSNIQSSALASTFSGDQVHSVALWFKCDIVSGDTLFSITQPSDPWEDDKKVISVRVSDESGGLRYLFWSNDIQYDGTEAKITKDIWYHLCVTYSGGGGTTENKKLYLNGNELHHTSTSGDYPGADLELPSGSVIRLGSRVQETTRFFGSIANFRLYSKALNADQVKELYDYQKDYFLGSKSQVTLYKGHLGVGVTEPSGQLELAGDERIQEYPPRGMTDFDTYIEGHGVFKASATSHGGSIGTSKYHAWKAFNKDRTDANNGDNSWLNGPDISGGDYNTSTGVYEGTEKHHGGAPIGAALQLSMPYEIYLKGYSLAPWNYATGTDFQYADSPSDFIIYGSKDNVNWVQIDSRTGQGMSSQTDIKRFSLDTRDSYSHFAIVVTKNNTAAYPSTSASFVAIEEWRLFGTPGPTTLDKGSLSLGRSLDVPRVSRYDVDTETPRPEKLVLDFDTTVNSSPTDISGRGNHGTFYNGASYSPADKAFDTPNATGILVRGSTLGSGAQPLTLCAWAKGLGDWNETANDTIIAVGPNSSTGHSSFQLCVNTDAITLDMASASNFLEFPTTITNGRWYFIAMTYTGGDAFTNTRVYVDGVEIAKPASWTNGTSATLSLPSNPDIGVGTRTGNGSGTTPAGYLAGMVSNPKIYNVALEPSEVQKLYRLGRTGRSMVISDTAVGIGKVPEAQLDVRGTVRFDRFTDTLRINHPGNQLSIGRSDASLSEFRWYAWSLGCNWFTPYTGKSIYIGRDGQTIDEFNFYNVTTVKRGSSIISSSDDRLKRDEAFITNATDTLLKLKPQTYIKKHRLPENENDDDIPEQFEAGLIAQDVWYDAPELRFLVHPSKDANPSETKPVSPDPNDPTQDPDYSSWGTTQAYVNYEGFLPYLIKSNQEIYNELQAEKARNDTLEARILALENA
jgi:hypothetical protein